jgi:streptogrisin C
MRSSSKSTTFAGVAALVLAAALTAAPAGAVPGSWVSTSAAEEASPTDVFQFAATQYATDYGVALDEAQRRLELQQSLVEIIGSARTLVGNRLARARLVHSPEFAIELHLAGELPVAGLEDLARAAGVPVIVEYGKTHSLDQLNALIQARISRWTERYPAIVGVYADGSTGQVVLDVQADAAIGGVIHQALLEDLSGESVGVRVETTDGEVGDGSRGGLDLTNCTSGFVVRNGSGTRGVLTAGHCGNTQDFRLFSSSSWFNMTFQDQARTDRNDVQWHTTGALEQPLFFGPSTTDARELRGRSLRGEIDGSYTCHRGRSTENSCGTVTSVTYIPTYNNACPGTTCAPLWVRAAGSNLRCYPGDSGGPFYNGWYAYGIYKGQSSSGTSASDCDWVVFMGIGYIQAINVDLMYS